MTLSSGFRLGPYQIVAPLGQGGMGEVYRATDTRLGRTVAIKVLPEAFAADPERRQRLEREARIASSLNHPHICALYDIGEEGGTHYLVMEYLEGRTLALRLESGRLPVEQALSFAIQIADALDKAHRHGVVHRDLKPANIMLSATGVKLLDFGLATRRTRVRGTTSEILTEDHQERITSEGAILGTLEYMAPEQLEGKEADGRTDIFAFGALVYEMVTGDKPFRSGSEAGLIGAILRDAPRPVGELVSDTPPALVQTISRCLSKDPDERWQTAADLLFQLRSIAAAAQPAAPMSRGEGLLQRRAVRRERAIWTASLIAAIVMSIVGTLLWTRRQNPEVGSSLRNEHATRFAMFPGEGMSIYSGFDMPFALSLDGRHIVWVGVSGNGAKQLWLRPWDSEVAQPMAGTEGASMPFWSPDNQWIGFFADESLKKVRTSGGQPQTVASGVTTFAGAAWSTSNVILIGSGPGAGISRVSAQGGVLGQATRPGSEFGEDGHLWPRFLSDGNHFIYASVRPAAIYLASLDGEAPRILGLFPGGGVSTLEYVPGYVLYARPDGGLFARAFDDQQFKFTGDPVRILDGIPLTGPGRAPFSASATGVLAYWPYAPGTTAVLRWFDRVGRPTSAVDAPARYAGFALSPDARQMAFARVATNGRSDIWVRDMTRGSESRVTSDGFSFTPIWSPDGTRITYSGARGRPPDLFIRNVGATGETRVNASLLVDYPLTWNHEGASIVSVADNPSSGTDLWLWQLQDSQAAVGEPLSLNTRFNESQARVSRDNRWIVYTTNESGRDEVWVATFPAGQNRRQVSIAGGTAPEWGASGAEIFYISRDKEVMATPFTAGDVGTPRALFRADNLIDPEDRGIFPGAYPYAVTTDGQRFLLAVNARDPDAPPISVILNWPALLTP
jgi:serine/threonine protein kinase/Tol biopolymer transport system component